MVGIDFCLFPIFYANSHFGDILQKSYYLFTRHARSYHNMQLKIFYKCTEIHSRIDEI